MGHIYLQSWSSIFLNIINNLNVNVILAAEFKKDLKDSLNISYLFS